MRIGFAGAQHFHIEEILHSVLRLTGVEPVGICDIAPHLNYIVEKYAIPRYGSLDEMIQNAALDAVICVDVLCRRAKVIETCLENGISVLSDKPPAITNVQLHQIQQAVSGSKRNYPAPVFSVIFSERYNPPVFTLKKLIDKGAIGTLVNFVAFRPHKLKLSQRPSWMFQRETYGGLLVDLAIHDVDIFHWLTGIRPLEITAYSSNYTCPQFPEFDDNAQMFFKAENGCTGFIKTEWLAPEAWPTHGDCRYFVSGTQGSIEVNTGGDIGLKSGKVILCTHDHPPVAVTLEEPGDIYQDFLVQVQHSRKPNSSDFKGSISHIAFEDIFNAMQVVLAAREAADTGRTIQMNWGKQR